MNKIATRFLKRMIRLSKELDIEYAYDDNGNRIGAVIRLVFK